MCQNDSQASAMQPSDVVSYMTGYSYGDDANGEGGRFNCWGLLRDVQRRFFGVYLPLTSLGDPMAAMYESRLKSGAWVIEQGPFHGAGVLMRAGAEPHCGVWLDFDGGGVLHCERGSGVRWQDEADLRACGYSNLKFYRFLDG